MKVSNQWTRMIWLTTFLTHKTLKTQQETMKLKTTKARKKAIEEALELKEDQDFTWIWLKDKNLIAMKAKKEKTAARKQQRRTKESHKISNNRPKQKKRSWS